MSFTALPTVAVGDAIKAAAWGNLVKTNFDDHEDRIVDLEAATAGTGDVVGPAVATDNALVRFDSTTGKLVQSSGITVADGATGTLSGTNTGDQTITLTGDVTGTGTGSFAATIANDAVTYAKMQNVSAGTRLLGRTPTGAGNVEEIALGSGLSMSAGGVLSATGAGGAVALDDLTDVVITTPATDHILKYNGSEFVNSATLPNHSATLLTSGIIPDARMPDLTGDVTTSEGAVATTIANDAVTNAKAANMAQATIKGRAVGAGTGDPTDLTATQATAILDAVVGDSGSGGTKGLAPAPASGDAAAGKFLKADGTWSVPSGGSASDSFKTIAVSGQSDVIADSATDTLTLVAGSNVTITTNAGTDTITIASAGGGGDSTTTGAHASLPSTTNDGNLYFPNNSFYVWRDNGSALVPWGPIFPLTAPVDGDFAWINQGGAAVDTTNGGIYLSEAANATLNWRIRKKAAPATPYTITALLLPNFLSVNYHQFGLVFRQASDGKLQTLSLQVNTGGTVPYLHLSAHKYTNATTFGSTYTTTQVQSREMYFLRIADNGTNRICSYSADGQHWLDFHSVGRTDYLTADEVGFGIDVENATFGLGMTLLSWKEA